MGDHHGKRRSTVKTVKVIDLKDGKIKLTEHEREKKFSKKTLDHNSARHLNLINKKSKSRKHR